MSSDIESDIKNIIVREARFEDAELIADLTRVSSANQALTSPNNHKETAEMVLSDLHRGGGFILTVNDVPCGAVRWLRTDDRLDCWEIRHISILPDYRGHDLSQHLLEAIIHLALSSDVEELLLGIRPEQTRMLDFYASLGFELAPEVEYLDQYDRQETALVMMRRLF